MTATAGAATGFRAGRFHAHDDLVIAYRIYGDRQDTHLPLLCLTGVMQNAKHMHRLAARHADRRRVLAMDYRGHGESGRDPDERNYRPEVYLRDILDFLTVAQCHRVVVVGTSLGGLLTMGLASARPSALAGAILNDIGPEIDTGGQSRILTAATADPRFETIEACIEALKTRYGTAYPDFAEADWREEAERMFVKREGHYAYHYDPALGRALADQASRPLPDLWPRFRALYRVPVLAFRAAHSDVLSAETFARMAAEHPRIVAVEVPERGHAPTLSEPVCEDAIDAFLEQF